MKSDSWHNAFLTILLILWGGCTISNQEEDETLFKNIPASHTGVNFTNEVSYDKDFNVISFPFLYNGAGVATGDINNDGLPDLYFAGNRTSSRLYLNKGNLKFKDITDNSGTSTNGWAGGVSMVDINGDGYLDIYVSRAGPESSAPEERKNLLFINNGDSTFTESAESFGIGDTGFTTHAAFFDFDRDGDLDLFLINNFPGSFARDNRSGLREEINDGSSKSTDALYRNNGDGTFTNVSEEAGILKEGYSLGLVVHDVNRDGWPDIYVSNDVQTDDLLYINNGDGTFTDKAADFFKHTSYAGMGTDIADYNNDGWPDLLQVDMLPPELEEQHLVTGSRDYNYLLELKQKGYQMQYNLNTLQLSNGTDHEGNIIFSEIGQLAGVEATGWSWAGLFGDYDNDGLKDVLVTNGYPKALNNYDYLMKLGRSSMFGTDSTRQEKAFELMDDLHSLEIHNYSFKNKGDLTFSDVSEEWGFTKPSFSYGAAHADLDNDGDLDLALNNLNGEAEILENRADSLLNNHYLTVQLNGSYLNSGGIGAKIVLVTGNEKQYVDFFPYRGYQSTMDHQVNFGLGDYQMIDSLEIFWPDGSYQLLENIEADQTISLKRDEAESNIQERTKFSDFNQPFFKNTLLKTGIDYKHSENNFIDYVKEPLLPQMLSRQGPPMGTADVNNDGRDDLFIGAASGSAGVLFIQREDGTFEELNSEQPWLNDRSSEDTGVTFFDANGDEFTDLYVVSGGNEFPAASAQLQDRLYLNSGNGKFVKANSMLPRIYTSGSVVKPADYNDDGNVDLFVGTRLVPGQYPGPVSSYILRNDGEQFTDVTADVAPELLDFGRVTDAEWVDINNDGKLDLVTVGTWMPVNIFANKGDNFEKVTDDLGLEDFTGWWYSLEAGDVDGNGSMDLIAGNHGLNHKYSSFDDSPLHIFADDFNGDDRRDAVMAVQRDHEYRPIHGLRAISKQVSELLQNIGSYQSYAGMSLERVVGTNPSTASLHYEADTFASSVFLNKGNFTFERNPLPNAAQISSVNDLRLSDINGNGNLDLLIVGNTYQSNPETSRNDAGNGLLLLGDGRGHFEPVSPFESHFMAQYDAKSLEIVETELDKYILIGNNDHEVQVYKIVNEFDRVVSQ